MSKPGTTTEVTNMDCDWVVVDRLIHAIKCDLEPPLIPEQDRPNYLEALEAAGISRDRAARTIGIHPRRNK